MNWKLLGIILGVAGIGALAARAAEGSVLDRERAKILKFFEVGPNCQISYTGNPATAAAFWEQFDVYLREIISLAATLQITDPKGVASYAALNLFPTCDQSQQVSNSLKVVLAAMQFRIGKLMNQ